MGPLSGGKQRRRDPKHPLRPVQALTEGGGEGEDDGDEVPEPQRTVLSDMPRKGWVRFGLG